jgi:hypothetical protein
VSKNSRDRTIDTQCHAHLDEIVEAKFLLDVELANLHQALGEEDEPRDQRRDPQRPRPREVTPLAAHTHMRDVVLINREL